MIVFHLSDRYLGSAAVLNPRLPRDPMRGENMRIQRVSVAPTLIGCMEALHYARYNRGRWFVYVADAIPDEPLHVPDAVNTGELWLLVPTRFAYAGRVAHIL